MSLAFLQQTPEQAFRRIEQDLKLASIDLTKFKRMTPRQLGECIARIDSEKSRVINENTYGDWFNSENYANALLLRDALVLIKEYKEYKVESEVIIPSFTYYHNVNQFGDMLRGQRCTFREGHNTDWVEFISQAFVEKSLLLLEHGTLDNFGKIYIELADGRADALENITLEHISSSSPEAQAAIEEYCNEEWDGPWPWEAPAPLKLHMMIQDSHMKKTHTIQEMQDRFATLVRKLNEGEMDQFEVVLAAREMVDKVQGMVEDLAKLSGETLMSLKDNARVAFGDEAANGLDQSIRDPLMQAADMLSQLRGSMENVVKELEGGAGVGAGAAAGAMGVPGAEPPPMGGDLGGPPGGDLGAPPPMGGEPGEPPVDAVADVDIDGEGEERPMKEM